MPPLALLAKAQVVGWPEGGDAGDRGYLLISAIVLLDRQGRPARGWMSR